MTETANPEAQKRTRRGKRLRRAALWTVMLTLLLVIAATGGAFYMIGRPVTAPAWVQERIEARLAEALPNVRVGFGDMMFVVEKGWRPRVRLRNVKVNTLSGVQIVAFSEAKASLSMSALIERKLQPRRIALTGVFATLRRDAEGRVVLRGGTNDSGPESRAASLPDLIKEFDRVMELPALASLREIQMRALTLTYVDLRSERQWTVDGGRLILARTGDDLDLSAEMAVLGGGAGVALLSANFTTRIGQQAADFGLRFDGVDARDIATQGPAFATLNVLRAPISGAVRSGVDENGRLQPLNATLQIGKGVLQPNDGTTPIPFDGARSYFSYDAAAGVLQFDELSVRSKWVTGSAEGQAILNIENGRLTDLVGQIKMSGVQANPLDIYPSAQILEAAELDVQVKLNPFQLKLGRLMVADQGQVLQGSGQLNETKDGWRLALDAQMDAITPERLLDLWPEALKPKTRTWIAQNVLQGDVDNIQMALRVAPDTPTRSLLSFEFSDASVRFLKTMPPVTQATGHGVLQDKRFVVALDRGTVTAPEGGDVKLTGSTFIIPDVGVKGGAPAIVKLRTRSALTAALSLLNQPPLNVLDKVNLPVDLAQGQAALTGTLAFPLAKGTKPQDVEFDVSGDLLALQSDVLVKGRKLRAEKMALHADNGSVSIGGKGLIDGVAFEGEWAQPIGKNSTTSRLQGSVEITQAALDAFNIALPPDMVSGKGRGDLDLTFSKGKPPEFSLRSDLRGLALSVPQVGWRKAGGANGKLEVAGTLGDTPQVRNLLVEARGLSAKGDVQLKQGGGLDRVRFERLNVGGWLDVPVDLVGQGAGRAPQVVVRGGTLDLRGATFGGSGQKGPPAPPMILRLDTLQITDTIAVTSMQGQFKTGGGLDGAFEGRINNQAMINGRVIPQNGRSAIRVQSADAGAVVRAAGLLKQAVGGTLSLTLLPVGSGGAFDGRLEVVQTRIKDAPTIAALLNAVSVVGLLEQLNGEGIYFDTVEADFRLTPNRMTLTSASAVGASMGISMDGVYATDTGQIAMQGVVSPVYLLNGIGAIFTRKGEGLIGFNYSLSGNAKSPKVSVNPLSALTPGMFRDIFRAPPPKLPEVEGVTGSTLSQPPATRPSAQQRRVEDPYGGR